MLRLRAGSLLLFLLLCGSARPALGQAKNLYWPEIAMRIRLDAEGTLHVTERQTMHFDGDWNGGERRFRLGPEQKLTFQSLTRIDPATGESRAVTEGDIDQVDRYAWFRDKTLRWRSRLPNDPPFQNQVIVYVLEYTLSQVLRRSGDSYQLAFDAIFPDRSGVVEKLVVDTELDPVWEPRQKVPAHSEKENLAPGEVFVVRADLAYRGAGAPAGVRTPTPLHLRYALFAAALLASFGFYLTLRRRETALGRYAPPSLPSGWDEAWLRDNVFAYRAEEVGALWDRSVGPPEVAATLARLVGEGKLASEVEKTSGLFGKEVLHLKLRVDRSAFEDYERTLIGKLFFGGRDATSTEEVRKHYKSKGFDPAGAIRPGLEAQLARHAELAEATPAPGRKRTFFLFLAALAGFALDAVGRWPAGLVFAGLTLAVILFDFVFATIAAVVWRNRVRRLDLGSLFWIVPGVLATLVCLGATFWSDWMPQPMPLRPGLWGDLALALLVAAIWSSLTHNAQSREGPSAIRRRQILGAARDLLRAELKQQQPRLQDDWFPYLLAFGLSREVDRWFRAFGGLQRTGFSPTYSTSGSGSSGGSWTGGGGAFGGAGASSSWAAAATGLAAGVATPGSSGGGGGGGGGGSSGGGGGGGW